MVGDSRITDVYQGSSEILLQRLSQDDASQPTQQLSKLFSDFVLFLVILSTDNMLHTVL